MADWPLGRRNRALAELRRAHFGPRLQGWTSCPECGEKLEFDVDGDTLAAHSDSGEIGGEVDVNGQVFRLPTSRDLARIAGEQDVTAAAMRLLEHCRKNSPEQEKPSLVAWTEEELEAIGERMAQADPLAEILLSFECPSCGGLCEEDLDLPMFLWTEMEGRAKRMLLDVHALASAYGWSEAEILALSEPRREFYLGMVHA
ncbi:MAG TPA: hypothetical protein VF865_10930 [Acidobacteriaceae bacterium]